MSKSEYIAIVRKDTFTNRWVADLYKDGKMFYKCWQYGWKTKRACLNEIEANNVAWSN